MRSNEFNNAAARLVFDIVGADGYVSDRELEIMGKLLDDKYELTSVDRVAQANAMSFSKALEILRGWHNKKDIETLIDELHLIAGYGIHPYGNKSFSALEGFCSLYEAWLLFAIDYALNNEDVTVFSINKTEYRFSKSEIIYIENDCGGNESIHQEMDARYEEFKARLELYGMRLIYIPKICEYLKEKRKQGRLMPLMRYVNPLKRYEDEDSQMIAENIDKITTSEFVKDFFPEKEKSIVKNLRPSFLLKIKTSTVVHGQDELPIKVTDFMVIPVRGSIRQTLSQAIEKYSMYTLDHHIPERKLHGRPFILHGFDRTFLNFAMSHILRADSISKIIFDFTEKERKKRHVLFVFDEKRHIPVGFDNKPMVLYLLIVIYSLYDNGLPAEAKPTRKKTQSEHEQLFSVLYKRVKSSNTGLYNNGGLATDINRLKRKLAGIPDKYLPVKDSALLRIPYITQNMVFIKFRGEEFRLVDKVDALMEKRHNKSFFVALLDLFN
jgi:hypothetical protein